MRKPKIIIKKIEERFIISDTKKPELCISVVVGENGGLTIYRRNYFNKPIKFDNSDPKVVEAVANLLLFAAKLGKNYGKEKTI